MIFQKNGIEENLISIDLDPKGLQIFSSDKYLNEYGNYQVFFDVPCDVYLTVYQLNNGKDPNVQVLYNVGY